MTESENTGSVLNKLQEQIQNTEGSASVVLPAEQFALKTPISIATASTAPASVSAIESELSKLRGLQKMLFQSLSSDQMRGLILKKMQELEFDPVSEYVSSIQTLTGKARVAALKDLIILLGRNPEKMEKREDKNKLADAITQRPQINIIVNRGQRGQAQDSAFKPEDYHGIAVMKRVGATSSLLENDEKKKQAEALGPVKKDEDTDI